jgi:hypothetical protein
MLITVLDGISRELDNLETRFRRCSWKLSNLKDEAMEVEGVSLKKVCLDKASDSLSKASASS